MNGPCMGIKSIATYIYIYMIHIYKYIYWGECICVHVYMQRREPNAGYKYTTMPKCPHAHIHTHIAIYPPAFEATRLGGNSVTV